MPIILLTGHTERRRVQEARDAGVSEILVKPVTAHDLQTRIETILKRPRPFIYHRSYCGPCRRLWHDPDYGGLERRAIELVSADVETSPAWQKAPTA